MRPFFLHIARCLALPDAENILTLANAVSAAAADRERKNYAERDA